MTQPDTARSSDAAQERGVAVAQDAKQEASAVADTAKQQAGRVADEARHQARDLAEDAREQLRQQASTQTEHLGAAMGHLGERVQALAEGRPEDAGPVRDVATRLGDQVQEIASRVDELGFDGAIDELQRFARRRPGAFLAGAAALGFAASRLAQGVKADQDGGDSSNTRDVTTGSGGSIGSGGSGGSGGSLGTTTPTTPTPPAAASGSPTSPASPPPPAPVTDPSTAGVDELPGQVRR